MAFHRQKALAPLREPGHPALMMPQPDYQKLIDAPTWAFIRESEAAYPPDTASLSIAEQRAIYDRMCRAFHRGYPPGVTARDGAFGGVPCRHYPGAGASVVYLHGGGFVVGGLHSHDDICAEICASTGHRVISVDYRLVPEHLHPAAFDDALAATRAVASAFGEPLVVVGDSAGGTLAAAVVHAAGRHGGLGIVGQVLIYAGLGGDVDKGSYLTHAEAPMLTRADVLYYKTLRHGGAEPGTDPTAAPLQDSDFDCLPPTVAFSAECDPIADDGEDYCARLIASGGRALWVREPGLVHGYLRARRTVPRAAASFARITQAIAGLARGQWPLEL